MMIVLIRQNKVFQVASGQFHEIEQIRMVSEDWNNWILLIRSSVAFPHFVAQGFLSVPSREILNGIAVTDENGNKLGNSTVSCQENAQIRTQAFLLLACG